MVKNKEVKSPYVPEEFNYNKLRDDNTVPAVIEIFQILAKNAKLLVPKTTTTQEEGQENEGKVAEKIKEVLVNRKVPNIDMQFLLNCFNSINNMFTAILRQKNEAEKVLLNLAIGSKDPGTGEPSLDYATMDDLFKSFMKQTSQFKKK